MSTLSCTGISMSASGYTGYAILHPGEYHPLSWQFSTWAETMKEQYLIIGFQWIPSWNKKYRGKGQTVGKARPKSVLLW